MMYHCKTIKGGAPRRLYTEVYNGEPRAWFVNRYGNKVGPYYYGRTPADAAKRAMRGGKVVRVRARRDSAGRVLRTLSFRA